MTQSPDSSSAVPSPLSRNTILRVFRLPLTFDEMATVLEMDVDRTLDRLIGFRREGTPVSIADLSVATRIICLESLHQDAVLNDDLKDRIISVLCYGLRREFATLQQEKNRLIGEVASLRRHLPATHASDADPIALTEAQIVAMKKPIEELNISGRAMNRLLEHGMTHIWRVCAMPNVMPPWKNLGKQSWNNIGDGLGWFNQQEGLGESALTLGMTFDQAIFRDSLPQHGFPILDEQQIRNMKLPVSELPLSASLRATLVGSGFDQLWKVCRWKTCNVSSHLEAAMIKRSLPFTNEDIWKERASFVSLLHGYSLGFDMEFDETLFTSP